MYEVELEAGRQPPLPDEIDELILAEGLRCSWMELQEYPARVVNYFRLLQHARHERDKPGGEGG